MKTMDKKKFNIVETVACIVSFSYDVEAHDEEEAMKMFKEGNVTYIEEEILGELENSERDITVEEIK